MAFTTSDHLLQRLHQWGVRRVFGYPGDGIGGLMAAFDRMDGQLQFVQARHEELAAFMACAHAKYTGEVGVCLATSGPGAIHLLNGLYDAKADHQPVLAIVGQTARSAMGGDYQQEVDLHSLFKDVAHDYVQTAMVPTQIRHLVDRAMRIARDRRAVTCLIVPRDLQDEDAVAEPPREHGTVHSGISMSAAYAAPAVADLQRAAEVLNAGRRVAILAGAGALHAGDELVAIAERLGAGIAKALLGKAAVPDDLPFVTGSIGPLGTRASSEMMDRCDTLLMVGSSFPYAEYLPREGHARGVQIDIDPRALSLRFPMEVGLVGDSRLTLRALLPLLEPQPDPAWRRRLEDEVARDWQVLEARALNEAQPINPQRVFSELSPRLPDGCLLSCDSGSAAAWYARHLKMRTGMIASLSGGLASMGSALPYGLAAKLAWPDRPVIALLGDGAMQMIGMNALPTLAHRWRDWAKPTFVVMVLNNGDLNFVTWEQRAEGHPRFEDAQALPRFPYADYARLLGLHALRIDRPEAIGPAWDAALAADRPTLLEMVTDPNVPPLPPEISAGQAAGYARALGRGDKHALRNLEATAREWWDALVGGKGGRNGKSDPDEPRGGG